MRREGVVRQRSRSLLEGGGKVFSSCWLGGCFLGVGFGAAGVGHGRCNGWCWDSPGREPGFVHAVADDEATTVPVYEGGVLGLGF